MSSLDEPPLSEIGMTKLIEQKFFSIICSNVGTRLLAALPPLKTTTFLRITDIVVSIVFVASSQMKESGTGNEEEPNARQALQRA